MWPDDVIADIAAYAASLGYPDAEIDIRTHWSTGKGEVFIDHRHGWVSMEYRIPHGHTREMLRPIVRQAGITAAEHLVRVLATKH